MTKIASATFLSAAVMLSLYESASAIRLPFMKRDASSTTNSTQPPPLLTLPMAVQFDGRGGYQIPVSMVSSTMLKRKYNLFIPYIVFWKPSIFQLFALNRHWSYFRGRGKLFRLQ